MKLTDIFSILFFVIIILPFFRIESVIKMQNTDFQNHVNKIKEIYFNQTLPNESSVMINYSSTFHKILWNLSGKNIDNLLFTYSLLLCFFSVLFRLLTLIFLLRHFSQKTTFFLLLLYFELPYILPGNLSYYLKYIKPSFTQSFEFSPGFRSFEKLTLHYGLLPSFIAFVFSFSYFLFPYIFPLSLIISLIISNFSGFATFLAFLIISILVNKNLRKTSLLLFVTLSGLFFSRIKTIIEYILPRIYSGSGSRFFSLFKFLFFILLISRIKKKPTLDSKNIKLNTFFRYLF